MIEKALQGCLVMNALALKGNKIETVLESKSYIAQEKLDGVRVTLHITEGGAKVVTRLGHDRSEVLLPLTNQKWPRLLHGSVIDGEVYDTSKTSAEISGLLHRKDEVIEDPNFFAFDLLQLDRKPLLKLPLTTRLVLLRHNLTQVCREIERIHLLSSIIGSKEEKLEFYEHILSKGGEGIMLKNIDASYIPGKRPANNWYKLKKTCEMVATILDFHQGQGKYEGKVGAIVYGTPDGVVLGRCSGINDILRLEMTESPALFIGRQIEIEGMEVLPSGALRHPRFKRFVGEE